jgi:hypothetical protein
MTKVELNLDYSKIRTQQNNIISDENEEKRLDELDSIFPEIMRLKAEEDLLLGIPVTKYDPEKQDYYTIYPDGNIIYGKETGN